MTTDLTTNPGSPNENFMSLDGESSIFKQNLKTQSENYINLGMLINSLEKDPQAFWGSIDSFFYKTITPSDKNNIDILIAQLSESSPDDAIPEVKEKLRIEDIVNPEYLASMSNGQKSMMNKKSEIDLVSNEFEKITKDQRILHIENVQQLLELKDRIMRDEDQHDSIFESEYSPLVYKLSENKSLSNLQNTNQQFFSKTSLQFQADFIKKLILELEDYQTAESIKYVIDCRKDGSDFSHHEFCIIFDKSISDTEIWIKESLLDKFDKFRDQSLFKIHTVPQKLYQSLNTFNITALFSCTQKQIHRRLDIKERPWKEVTIKSLGENPSSQSNIFYKEQMQLKANQLELCHHCGYLFPKEFTFGCNYHSSTMGYNSNQSTKTNTDLLKDMEKNQSLNYMYNWNEEKDEYVCGRRYCTNCLKSNYDVNIHHMKTDRHWLCPFCKGVCFCSRCLRNDQINKLIQLYLDIGGNPKAIIAESSLRNILWKTVKKTPPKLSEDLIITLPRPINHPGKVKRKNSKKKNRPATSDPGLLKKLKVTPEKEKLLERKKECQSNKAASRSSRSKNKELSHCQEEPLLSYRKSLYKIPKSNSNLEIPSLSSLKLESLKIGSNEELNKMHFQFEDFHDNQK